MNIPAPLTQNQKAYLDRSLESWLNVAEGGKRGGKNVLSVLAWGISLDEHPDKMHLASGVSIATAKLNILDCDGFGLLNYFDGRCRLGEYLGRTCLHVGSRVGEKMIMISGGGKEGDERLIKGNTYGTAYVTEANECSKTFVLEVNDRTLTSSRRQIFHDLNPKAPKHWYYEDFLNDYIAQQKKNPASGINYGHFTIADNLSISDEQLRTVLRSYPNKTGVWYRRDIRGERCITEGAIYQAFAQLHKELRVEKPADIVEINVGVDFGGGKAGHAFVASAITRRGEVVALASERHMRARDPGAKEIDPAELGRLFVAFCNKIVSMYGMITWAFCDSAEQTLIAGLRTSCAKGGLPWMVSRITNALKTTINDRIRATEFLAGQRRFLYVSRDCATLESALLSAVWDVDELTEDVRLDDGTSDIDTLDAFEYTFESQISRLLRI